MLHVAAQSCTVQGTRMYQIPHTAHAWHTLEQGRIFHLQVATTVKAIGREKSCRLAARNEHGRVQRTLLKKQSPDRLRVTRTDRDLAIQIGNVCRLLARRRLRLMKGLHVLESRLARSYAAMRSSWCLISMTTLLPPQVAARCMAAATRRATQCSRGGRSHETSGGRTASSGGGAGASLACVQIGGGRGEGAAEERRHSPSSPRCPEPSSP